LLAVAGALEQACERLKFRNSQGLRLRLALRNITAERLAAASSDAERAQISQQIDSGERVVVGVNRYRLDTEEPYDPPRPNPELEREQAQRLDRLRAERSSTEVNGAMDELRRVASAPAGRPGPEHNVLYPMRRALAARATVGEVCGALREVWGVYLPNDAF